MTKWLDDLCPVLAQMVRERKTTGKSGRVFSSLGALSTINNLRIIHGVMRLIKPSHTMEIGLAAGGSALAICASHRELGHAPQAQHCAIDPHQLHLFDSCALSAAERAGLLDYIDYRFASSAVELPKLYAEGRKFGLIYVDGSHLFEDVFVDAYFSVRLLEPGGVILFDDSTYPHVAKVIRFIGSTLKGRMARMDLAPFTDRKGYRIAQAIGRVQMTAFQRVGNPERPWGAKFRNF